MPQSTSPSMRDTVFATPSKWLAALDIGFRYDPFAFFEAERMPPDALEETFVAHPGFDEHIMNFDRSAVLLAPRGSGKTASRLRLETKLSQRQRNAFNGAPHQTPPYSPLVVVYSNFEAIVESLPEVNLQDHMDPLLSAVAEAIFKLIVDYPKRFLSLDEKLRNWWWAFLETHLPGEPLYYRLRTDLLSEDWNRIDKRPHPFLTSSTYTSILKSLLNRIQDLYLDSIFILVDGVDGYPETQSLPKQEALVSPLLNALPLLSLPHVVWKFFLPSALEGLVRRSAGYETGRLDVVRIQWDEYSLIKLLQERLKWASEGGVGDLSKLCTEELIEDLRKQQKDDLERKPEHGLEWQLARMALQHQRLGPPRALLELGQSLFRIPQTLKEERISLFVWQKFHEEWDWLLPVSQ